MTRPTDAPAPVSAEQRKETGVDFKPKKDAEAQGGEAGAGDEK